MRHWITRCAVCGCRFHSSNIKQLVCWDCLEDKTWKEPTKENRDGTPPSS